MKKFLSGKTNGRFLKRAFIDLRDVFFFHPVTKEGARGKNILIFNWRDTKHAFAGGAEVYIHELAKRWVTEGNTVTLFCGSDGKSKRNEIVDGVRVIRRGGFYFVYIWAFVYYLAKFRGKYDVIVDCENGIPFFTPLYTKVEKYLVIHHVHQEIFRKSLIPPFSWLASFLEGKLMPFVYRNVKIITVSPSSKEEILKHNLTAIEPAIIYNGIDHEAFVPGKKARRPLVLYVGRLQSYKSLHIFLESAKAILKKVPETQFVIAGNGEERRKLQRLVKKLELTESVQFTGYITEAEKIALFQKAWVFVNPSLREGWGITTIEANACGTPVVASKVPGLKDAIVDQETGILVPYGDIQAFTKHIVTLLTDTGIRDTLSRAAILWARQYNWDTSAHQFSLILNSNPTPVTLERKSFRFSYYMNKISSLLF